MKKGHNPPLFLNADPAFLLRFLASGVFVLGGRLVERRCRLEYWRVPVISSGERQNLWSVSSLPFWADGSAVSCVAGYSWAAYISTIQVSQSQYPERSEGSRTELTTQLVGFLSTGWLNSITP